ncbi:AraC family transcriptional regulator [Haloimpatiens massiliensis]|uniref:AraC family transcriptional regulator n=1 Tax=Haloimpatiens massiliensis TaxID=1658110 RepID=UPI000C85B5CE|nr:GyrI-like domain-containing protein [Haloimpatiens massiliensis]
MEWLKKLSQSIDYIENNLDGTISYEEISKIADCSIYSFQRMFSYIAGIPLAEYIRRRRMTAAAFEIQTKEIKIMDIALKYGYTSPTAFNRAFQSIHGVAPTLARSEGTLLEAYPRISLSISVSGGESMKYRIEKKGPIRIIGIRTGLQENFEYNFKVVPEFWNETLKKDDYFKICNLNNQSPKGILGLTLYENPKEIYYYIATSTDKNAPKNMLEYTIPSATWVIFECNGNFKESIQTIFKKFLTEWLPFSNYEYAGLPDIEIYPIAKSHIASGYSEVWIAINKVSE